VLCFSLKDTTTNGMAARRRTAEFRSSLGGSLQHQTSQGVNWLLAQLSSAKSARSRMRASTRCSISDTRCWPSASKVATYSAEKLGLEGIVSKRKDSAYRSGRSPDWLKMKNADAPAVKREAEEDWADEPFCCSSAPPQWL
jgi:hypothetical protein